MSNYTSAQRFFDVGAIGVVLGVVLALMSVAAYVAHVGLLPLAAGAFALAFGFFGVGLMASGWAIAGRR